MAAITKELFKSVSTVFSRDELIDACWQAATEAAESKLTSTQQTKVTIPPCTHSLPNVDGSDGMTCGKCGGTVCCYQAEQ